MNVRKIGPILGLKGFLAICSLISVALALVTYSASVTITPTQQFTIGSSSESWNIYLNEVDQSRYLPGGSSTPVFNPADLNTYAFAVVTDASQSCAIKIELTSAMDNSKFSKFDITIEYRDGASWIPATIYDSPTGPSTITEIDGLTSGSAGYIQQDVSLSTYYLVKVTYSYDLVDDSTQITTNFQYTPLP
jgi:hypothetical protein